MIKLTTLLTEALLLTVLTGCIISVPEFTMTELDNRFSSDGTTTFSSDGNRISTKSIPGGVHINEEGVYVNPYIIIHSNGGIESIGFFLINDSEHHSGPMGSSGLLGTLKKIIFRLPDGELIDLQIFNQNRRLGHIDYNPIDKYAGFDIQESGFAEISRQQFIKIANANYVSCKIIGSRKSVTYEKDDISDSFLENIKEFATKFL